MSEGILRGISEGLRGGLMAFQGQQELGLRRRQIEQEDEQRRQAAQLAQERDDREFQQRKDLIDYALPGKIQVAQLLAGIKGTPGQQALDKGFAEQYVEDVTKGGSASSAKNIEQLGQAAKTLEKSDVISGPLIGLIPQQLRNIVAPESVQVQQDVEGAIQNQLKQTLGAQFAEREGRELLARAYNPQAEESVNKARVERFMKEAAQARAAKDAANAYYEKYGTLRGFKGKTYQSAADFTFDKEQKKEGLLNKKEDAPKGSGMTPEQRRARIEELRAKVGK
jgi:hypothetical protein